MKAVGLPDRQTGKLWGYAWLYGAGDQKLGAIVGKGAAEANGCASSSWQLILPWRRLRAVKSATQSRGYLVGWTVAGCLCAAAQRFEPSASECRRCHLQILVELVDKDLLRTTCQRTSSVGYMMSCNAASGRFRRRCRS